jgi:hypothetical protein
VWRGDFMNLFAKKAEKQPTINIAPLKSELKKQEIWLKQLHTYSTDLHKYANYIHNSNAKHKKKILEQIDNLVNWVDYFNKNHLELKQEVTDLKLSLRKQLRHDFEVYHKTLEQHMALKLEQESMKKEQIKEQIFNEIMQELFRQNEKKQQGITNEYNDKPINNITHYVNNDTLTNSEKELLNLLFNENKPLTYENISKKMNRSVNTIRVYMNSLKSKKQIIDEFITPKGTKIFSIKNSEMVKTLFNIKG